MDYWLHRMLVVITMLCVIMPTWSVTIAQAAPDQRDITLVNADKLVRVIIVLKNNTSANGNQNKFESIEYRRMVVAVAQADFVRRQGALLRGVTRRFHLAPMLVAAVRTSDIAIIQRDPAVARIQIDKPHPPTLDQSTTLIGSRAANTAGYAGAGTSVAILDTGVRKTHPFLTGRVIAEACFSTTDSGYKSTSLCPDGVPSSTAVNSALPCASDVSGCNHGTHVAGIVAGNRLTVDGLTMSGVAPDAKLIAVQIYSRFPAGGDYCGTSDCVLSFDSDQTAALEWLYEQRATPAWGTLASVNMSLGGDLSAVACNNDATAFYIAQLRSVGVATVIASGNDASTNGVSYPGCVAAAITVGASQTGKDGAQYRDTVAGFSNSPALANNTPDVNGDRVLDFFAPGQPIYSSIAYPGTTYAIYSGTSMATPHVAGAWALLKGMLPDASVSQILQLLTTNSMSITDARTSNRLTIPRIDVASTINRILDNRITRTATATVTVTNTKTNTRTATNTPTRTSTWTKTRTNTLTTTRTATDTRTQTLGPQSRRGSGRPSRYCGQRG